MTNEFYILSVKKASVKEFIEKGIWSEDSMTSVIVRKENGSLIQIFGSGKCESYGEIGTQVKLCSSTTCKVTGYGKIVDYSDDLSLVRNVTTYIFK